MGYSVIPAKKRQQYHNYFITCERDPSVDAEAGKKKLLGFLTEQFGRINVVKSCAAAEEGSSGYKHYHALVKLARPVRWEAINKKMKVFMAFDKKGKSISTWWGRGRTGEMDTYGDWEKYLKRPGVKMKEIDAEGVMALEEDEELEAWRKHFLREDGWSLNVGLGPVEVNGKKIGLFDLM